MKVAIVDYGMGNVDSVVRAVEELGATTILCRAAKDLEGAGRIILPGVGSFAAAMRGIRKQGLDEALSESVLNRGTPFLGICLGMQLLAKMGCEGGTTKGLGWIEGEVRRLTANGQGERIPHVGWNTVEILRHSRLLRNVPQGKDFYFAHSYVLACDDALQVAASTNYCGGFHAVVEKEHIFGVQFHPEKSQRCGMQLLGNFLSL